MRPTLHDLRHSRLLGLNASPGRAARSTGPASEISDPRPSSGHRRLVAHALAAVVVSLGLTVAMAPVVHAESVTDGDDAPASIDIRSVRYRYSASGLAVRIKFDDLRKVRRTSFGVHLTQDNPGDISSNQAIFLRVTARGHLQRGYLNLGDDDTYPVACDDLNTRFDARHDLIRFWLPRTCLDDAYPIAFGERITVGVASALYSREAWSSTIDYLREPGPLWGGDKGKATKADLVAGTSVGLPAGPQRQGS